jgi:Domain of unknown function (DUF6089)
MRNIRLLAACLLVGLSSSAQNFHLGVFGGLSNYEGDLVDGAYKQSKGAIGITLGYELNDHWMARAGFTHAKVTGADKFSAKPDLRLRNLSFESPLNEFSLLLEYSAFNLYEKRYTPYFFGGLAIYHFNPYTYAPNGLQVFLKPLSTEGEGLTNYPERKPYSLTQMSIPFGAGMKFAVNDNIRIGLEVGFRKLFTDYLDDVSKTFVAESDLLAERGPQAVEFSYRSDEVGGSPLYPAKGQQRGNDKYLDWYYFSGIHITFRLPGAQETAGKKSSYGGGKKYGCPASPL